MFVNFASAFECNFCPPTNITSTFLRDSPPLCKGRWLRKQLGGIVTNLVEDPQLFIIHYSTIKTTSSTSGLHCPYKGLLLAQPLKGAMNCDIALLALHPVNGSKKPSPWGEGAELLRSGWGGKAFCLTLLRTLCVLHLISHLRWQLPLKGKPH